VFGLTFILCFVFCDGIIILQLDIRGDPYGFLAAHPLAPLVSLHHLVYLDPMFPNKNPIESLQTLMKPYTLDPNRILQQINCHDRKRQWSISISWGYTIQIYTYFLTATELTTPLQTFKTWRSSSDGPFVFNTRPLKPDPCERPVTYFMDGAEDVRDSGTKTWYSIGDKNYGHCGKIEHTRLTKVKRILVTSMKTDPEYWNKVLSVCIFLILNLTFWVSLGYIFFFIFCFCW
jgi:hypothetical protein